MVAHQSTKNLKAQFNLLWEKYHQPEWVYFTPAKVLEWIQLAKKIGKTSNVDAQQQRLFPAIIWIYTFFQWTPIQSDQNQIIQQLLSKHNYSKDEMTAILNNVNILLYSPHISSLPAQVIHDTIWSFTGRNRFQKEAALWRIEEEAKKGHAINEVEWTQLLMNTLIEHPFLTDYGKSKFENKRFKHLASLRSRLAKDKAVAEKEKSGKNLGRGIDTLYRVNFNNHINLSSIADGKANIMISINTILLSIIITVGSTNLSFFLSGGSLNIIRHAPLFILLTTCVASLIFAVLSTRPKITEKPNASTKHPNLLFFGHFTQVSQQVFKQYMTGLKEDHSLLYKELSKDLYNLGLILKKKYDLLTIAYNIFLIGIILTFISFILLQL